MQVYVAELNKTSSDLGADLHHRQTDGQQHMTYTQVTPSLLCKECLQIS
jgi:hypothetical protein